MVMIFPFYCLKAYTSKSNMSNKQRTLCTCCLVTSQRVNYVPIPSPDKQKKTLFFRETATYVLLSLHLSDHPNTFAETLTRCNATWQLNKGLIFHNCFVIQSYRFKVDNKHRLKSEENYYYDLIARYEAITVFKQRYRIPNIFNSTKVLMCFCHCK